MFKRLILSITFLLHHKSLSKIFSLKQEVGIKTKTRRDIGKMYRKQTRRNEENIFDHIFLKSRFNNDKMSCDQQHATSGWTRYSLCFKYRLYSNISMRDGVVVTWIALLVNRLSHLGNRSLSPTEYIFKFGPWKNKNSFGNPFIILD